MMEVAPLFMSSSSVLLVSNLILSLQFPQHGKQSGRLAYDVIRI